MGFPHREHPVSLTGCSSHPSLQLSYMCLHLDLVYDLIMEEKQVQEGCGSSQLKFGVEPAWVNCPWDESWPSSVKRGVQLFRWGCSHCRLTFRLGLRKSVDTWPLIVLAELAKKDCLTQHIKHFPSHSLFLSHQ